MRAILRYLAARCNRARAARPLVGEHGHPGLDALAGPYLETVDVEDPDLPAGSLVGFDEHEVVRVFA